MKNFRLVIVDDDERKLGHAEEQARAVFPGADIRIMLIGREDHRTHQDLAGDILEMRPKVVILDNVFNSKANPVGLIVAVEIRRAGNSDLYVVMHTTGWDEPFFRRSAARSANVQYGAGTPDNLRLELERLRREQFPDL